MVEETSATLPSQLHAEKQADGNYVVVKYIKDGPKTHRLIMRENISRSEANRLAYGSKDTAPDLPSKA